MKKKAIVFLRVSTTKQTLQQQEELMLKVAMASYKRDEIVIIKGTESATKLTFDERKTLTALFDTIKEHPTIERIFCFAVDRIARKATIVNQTVKDLASKGVDVYFHYPYQLHSLDANGRLSLMADLMLYFLGVGAEQETLLRNERVQAKRELMRANNQLITGKPAYGYKLDADKHIIVNEDEGKWVRYCITKYAEGNTSLKQLSDELIQKGVFPNSNYSTNINRVRIFIRNGIYSGREPLRGGCNVYPPIVSVEIQDKAREIARNNKNTTKKISKNVYYGKGIVKTDYNEHVMIPNIHGKTYKTTSDCKPSIAISINAMDTIIWGATKFYYVYMLANKADNNKEMYAREIETNKAKIANIKNVLDELDKQFTRSYRQYVKGNVPESVYEEEVNDNRKQQAKWNKEIATLESANTQLQSLIDNVVTRENFQEFIPTDATDEHRKEIVNQLWEKFLVGKDSKGHFHITMYLKDTPNTALAEWFDYWVSGGVQHLIQHRADGKTIDISKAIVKRF